MRSFRRMKTRKNSKSKRRSKRRFSNRRSKKISNKRFKRSKKRSRSNKSKKSKKGKSEKAHFKYNDIVTWLDDELGTQQFGIINSIEKQFDTAHIIVYHHLNLLKSQKGDIDDVTLALKATRIIPLSKLSLLQSDNSGGGARGPEPEPETVSETGRRVKTQDEQKNTPKKVAVIGSRLEGNKKLRVRPLTHDEIQYLRYLSSQIPKTKKKSVLKK